MYEHNSSADRTDGVMGWEPYLYHRDPYQASEDGNSPPPPPIYIKRQPQFRGY
ncbi:MAG: hypothetical protein GY820_03375 [Gammaproteobacteria bacterium]|nr:hypothetical protein [Gammaproteobacteria bacterium]